MRANQVQKNTRQILNSNQQLEDEIADKEKTAMIKEKKANELVRQRDHLEREIAEVDRDVKELEKCKLVLGTEISEETSYQQQMWSLIAQLKRNIYEVKNEREKYVKEINQEKKIY